TTQCLGLPPTGPGNHRPDGTQANNALTVKLDQLGGADQPLAYDYVGFGSFELALYDNRLKWRGFDYGFFDKIVSQVEPNVSKVADDVYFLSWNTPGGTDNVVVNFDQDTVHAHLWSGPSSVDDYSDFDQIHGQILCEPSKECPFPEGAPTGSFGMAYHFIANSWKYDLPSLTEFQPPLVQSHTDGLAELTGKPLQYEGDSGAVTLQINDQETLVSIDRAAAESFHTHVTKIADGIYFISWLDEPISGDHIVFNKNAMQVFDHVTSEAVRGEQILAATCFGPAEDCS
ncbi:hypothetical protein SAMN05444003_3045, partial [Cognatiyoonia sediminum]